jgi:hypothetical protein
LINVIIFSKDRPLQLEAVLRSFFFQCQDPENFNVHVLYKYSNDKFKSAYNIVRSTYPQVNFNLEVAFGNQVRAIAFSNKYVLFVVDDVVFIRPFSSFPLSLLSAKDMGVSLRLGANITYAYMFNRKSSVPRLDLVNDNIYRYTWLNATGDWTFPLEVSSSIYSINTIAPLLRSKFTGPNNLEAHLHIHRYNLLKPTLLVYGLSCSVGVPLNKVQVVYPRNRSMASEDYTIENMLGLFIGGKRINVEKLYGIIPSSVHEEIQIEFINEIPQTTI